MNIKRQSLPILLGTKTRINTTKYNNWKQQYKDTFLECFLYCEILNIIFAVIAYCGSSKCISLHTINRYTATMATNTIPGRNPQINRRLIDVSVATPKIIRVMLGGITVLSAPEDVISPRESFFPCASFNGS